MDQPSSSFHNSITTSPRNFGMVLALNGKPLATLQTLFDSTRYLKAKNKIAVEHLPFPQRFRLSFLQAAMKVVSQAVALASTPKLSMSWLHIPRAHCSNFIVSPYFVPPPVHHAQLFHQRSTQKQLLRYSKLLCSFRKMPSTNHLITV